MRAPVHYLEDPRARHLERIIVGHDLNAGGAAALASALVLARQSAASIHLVHTVDPRGPAAHCSCLDKCACFIEERVAGAGMDLEDVIERRIDCQPRIDYEVRVGKPYHEIMLAACAWHADLIVVGAPRRKSFNLRGGTAERLARKAFAPVLVTPRPLTSMPGRFLIATDFSPVAQHAAQAGIGLGKSLGARISFLHVLDPTPWYGYGSDQETLALTMIPGLTEEDFVNDRMVFLKSLPLDSLAWEFHTVEGPPASRILQHAEEIRADLIIMGAHGRTAVEHLLLGSVKRAVLRKAATAVLTIGRAARPFHLPQVIAKKRMYR
jgi:nucleotide-binding universal stress UspA family protein